MGNDWLSTKIAEQVADDMEKEWKKKYGKLESDVPWFLDPFHPLGWRIRSLAKRLPNYARKVYKRYLSPKAMRIWRYHPSYLPSGLEGALDMDDDPFPKCIADTRIGDPFKRRMWLENYYQSNPTALHRVVNNPQKMQHYFQRHLSVPHRLPPEGFDPNVNSMKAWVHEHAHTVKPGENLSRIANYHKIPLSYLKETNKWLKNRPRGFGLLHSGDKIILPWRLRRDQVEPFPREVSRIRPRYRQHFLRHYYRANPWAAQRARSQSRTIIDWAHKHLRSPSSHPVRRPISSLSRPLQHNSLRRMSRGLVNPHRARPMARPMRSMFC